jgi:hypothetical protein
MKPLKRHAAHAPRKPWYLVVRGRKVCFASPDRSLAEAYFHGQSTGSVVLMSAQLMLPVEAQPPAFGEASGKRHE